MAHFVFLSNSIATPVPPHLFTSVHLELFFMPILRKCAKLKKKKNNNNDNNNNNNNNNNCDGMFFIEVSLQHPNLRKWNPTMSAFLGITEIIF